MSLLQDEADRLLQMEKEFVDSSPIEFTTLEPMDCERELRSLDRREAFLLTLERGGSRNRARLKYQTRARRIIVLARLELNGPRHRNPPDSPYKPGEWLSRTHLHLYREGYEDQIAYELRDAPGWPNGVWLEGIPALERFMRFCAIMQWPTIQTSM